MIMTNSISLMIALLLFLILRADVNGQPFFEKTAHLNSGSSRLADAADDSVKFTPRKSSDHKTNFGGIFLSPTLGVSFPTGKYGELSNSGFFYGFKLEVGHSKLYPFVLGIVYESQSNPGNPDFTTSNFLTQFDTDITYYGGSVDILLNKYIKSDFTAPIIALEGKFANVKRTVTPDTSVPEILREESIFTYSAGLLFTLYIFDLGGKYTFAGDYSNLTFNMRIHIPIVRF